MEHGRFRKIHNLGYLQNLTSPNSQSFFEPENLRTIDFPPDVFLKFRLGIQDCAGFLSES